MLLETRQLIANYDKYFKRLYKWQYSILLVDNHFMDVYSFFMNAHKGGTKLHYSHDLMEMKRDPAKLEQVLTEFRTHSQMRIERRDTRHLIHPGRDIKVDLGHGHGGSNQHHRR
jgi:hypothetical protein